MTATPLVELPLGVLPPEPLSDARLDRQSEAARVTDFILGTPGRIMVLHGDSGIGKTELIRRWVIPRLKSAREGRGEILYGVCARGLPGRLEGTGDAVSFDDAVGHPAILILDSFEQVLDLPRDERRERLDHLFARIQATDARAVAVLVTDSRQLTSVYALTTYDPELAGAVLELAPVGLAEGLQELSLIEPESAVEYPAQVLGELAAQALRFQKRGWATDFALMKVADGRFRELRRESGRKTVGSSDVVEVGGLRGILRWWLERRLDLLEVAFPGAQPIGHAILAQVAADRPGAEDSFAALAARLGVPETRVRTVLDWLCEDGGLLRPQGEARFQLAPPQLAAVLEEDAAGTQLQVERALRIVDEGLRSRRQLGDLLPRTRFEEVHAERQRLHLAQDQIRFLLQCALRHDAVADAAARYWLGRMGDAEDGVDVLLASLFDDFVDVRARAARLLGDLGEDEVRTRLHAIALTDPEPAVREAAVNSLARMRTDELLRSFVHEAVEGKAPQRGPAIEALRIFPNPWVPQTLQTLIADRETPWELREKAIRSLAAAETPEAVDALVRVALEDEDHEDRQAAAAALGSVGSEALNQHILDLLHSPSPTTRIRLTGVVLGMAALAAAWGFHEVVFPRFPILGVLLALGSLPLVIATKRLLRGMRDGKVVRSSSAGILGIGLFALAAVSVIFWFHGLAHLMLEQRRRALALFSAEVLGIMCLMFAVMTESLPGPVDLLSGPYYIVGFLLFVGSYVWDIVGALTGTIVFAETAVREGRKATVYRRILANPVATARVVAALRSANVADREWAGDLLRCHGEHAPVGQLIELLVSEDRRTVALASAALAKSKTEDTVRRLVELWPATEGKNRRRIALPLYRRPTEESLKGLELLKRRMDPRLRLRSAIARWQFRFAVWPPMARLAGSLLVPIVLVFLFHGWKVARNPEWSMIGIVRSPVTPDDRKMKAVDFLAETYPDQSAGPLLEEFEAGNEGAPGPVDGAIAEGLLRIYNGQAAAATPEVRLQWALVSAVENFAGLLARDDSTEFARGLSLLSKMGASPRAAVRDTAVLTLARYVRGAPDTSTEHRFQVAESLLGIFTDWKGDSGAVMAAAATAMADRFAELLLYSDSTVFERALRALGTMAAAPAPTVADTAARILSGFVTRNNESKQERRFQAVRLLASLPYERALPALDSAATTRSPRDLDTALAHLERVALSAYRSVNSEGDLAGEGRALLEVLKGLKSPDLPPSVLSAREDLEEAVVRAGLPDDMCGPNTRQKCDEGAAAALQLIKENPLEEHGYRDLLNPLIDAGQYDSATALFHNVKQRYAHSIWPRKILAELYHEYQATDSAAFRLAYDEMNALRRLPAYRKLDTTDHDRVEGDFIEVLLSAEHYEELDSLSSQLLTGTEQPVTRLNVALFAYFGEVMQGDRESALAKLSQLEAVIASLPPHFYNAWLYPGTLEFIQRSGLSEQLRTALERLCKEDYWYSAEEAAAVVAENQAALTRLTAEHRPSATRPQ
jgi:hypothetical protein